MAETDSMTWQPPVGFAVERSPDNTGWQPPAGFTVETDTTAPAAPDAAPTAQTAPPDYFGQNGQYWKNAGGQIVPVQEEEYRQAMAQRGRRIPADISDTERQAIAQEAQVAQQRLAYRQSPQGRALLNGENDPDLNKKLATEIKRYNPREQLGNVEDVLGAFNVPADINPESPKLADATPTERAAVFHRYFQSNMRREGEQLVADTETATTTGQTANPEARALAQGAATGEGTAGAAFSKPFHAIADPLREYVHGEDPQAMRDLMAQQEHQQHPVAGGIAGAAGMVSEPTMLLATAATGGTSQLAMEALAAKYVAQGMSTEAALQLASKSLAGRAVGAAATAGLGTFTANQQSLSQRGELAGAGETAETIGAFLAMGPLGKATGKLATASPAVRAGATAAMKQFPTLARVSGGYAEAIAGMLEANMALRTMHGQETTAQNVFDDIAMAVLGHTAGGGPLADLAAGHEAAPAKEPGANPATPPAPVEPNPYVVPPEAPAEVKVPTAPAEAMQPSEFGGYPEEQPAQGESNAVREQSPTAVLSSASDGAGGAGGERGGVEQSQRGAEPAGPDAENPARGGQPEGPPAVELQKGALDEVTPLSQKVGTATVSANEGVSDARASQNAIDQAAAPDTGRVPPQAGGRGGEQSAGESIPATDVLTSPSAAHRPGLVAALRQAARKFRGISVEDDGTNIHFSMPDGTRIQHVLAERLAPAEHELDAYLQSAKAENDGAQWFEHDGRDVKIPADADGWAKLSDADKIAILDNFRVHGAYDHTAGTITTTLRVINDHTIAGEELFHAQAARLKVADRDTYNRMINRYDNEDAAFRKFMGKATREKFFERIRKGTAHESASQNERPLTPRQQAESLLLQNAQQDGVLMSDEEFEQFHNDQAGLHPDHLDHYTPREQARLRPFVNVGAWSDMVERMGTARAEAFAERLANEVLTTKAEKIQKAADYYRDEHAHPDLQKAAALVRGEEVAEPAGEPDETEPTAEEVPVEGGGDIPFAVRKRGEEEQPINTDLLGNRVGAKTVGGGISDKSGNLFGDMSKGAASKLEDTRKAEAPDKDQGRLFGVRKTTMLDALSATGLREFGEFLKDHPELSAKQNLPSYLRELESRADANFDGEGSNRAAVSLERYLKEGVFKPRNNDAYFAVRKRGEDEIPITPKPAEQPEDQDTRPGATLFGQYDQSPTGIRNAQTDKMRANLGLAEAAPVLRRSYSEDVMREARAAYDANPKAGEELAASLDPRHGGKARPITDTEDALLTMHQVDLQTAHAALVKEIVDAKGKGEDPQTLRLQEAALSDKLLQHYNVTKAVGTANARGLAARRIMMNEDYSLASMETRARAARGGEPLTAKEKEIITELHQKLADANTRLEEYTKAAEAKLRKAQAKKATDQVLQEGRAARVTVAPQDNGHRAQNFTSRREALLAGMRQKAASLTQGLSAKFAVREEGPTSEHATPDEGPASDWSQVPGITRDLTELAKLHVEDGVGDREKLLDLVHEDTLDIFKGMSRREKMDAISGYGKFHQLSKEDLAVQMRDLKGQMQQVGKLEDMQAGQPPSKTGVERRTPSEEERHLIQQVNEAKKRLNIQTTDPETQLKSALQARKTALTNQIKDLEYQIAKGEKIVRNKADLPGDAELAALKARRDAAQEDFYKIFGKPGTSEAERMAAAVKSAERAAEEAERQVKAGELVPLKMGQKTSPELDAARARGAAARAELQHLRDTAAWYQEMQHAKQVADLQAKIDANSQRIATGDIGTTKTAKTPDAPEVAALKKQNALLNTQLAKMREDANPTAKKTPDEIALQAFKTRTLGRIAELTDKMLRQDFGPEPAKKPLGLDAEAQRLQATAERFKQAYEDQNTKARYAARSFGEKAQDYFTAWRRFAILSGPAVVAKLSAAASARLGITPGEELIGGGISKVLPRLSAKAAREGGMSLKAETDAIMAVVKKGMPEAWKTLKTGQSDLSAVYGERRSAQPTPVWLEFFGRLHGALKEPVKQAEWARSFEKRLQANARAGVDVADPIQQMRIGQEAYQDANRAIFMQDNVLSDAWKRAMSRFEEVDRTTGKAKYKAFGTLGKTLLPIVKVPTNIVAETLEYATGSVLGSVKAAKAYHAGVEKLSPAQADIIMRQMKKGALGAAVMTLGYFGASAVGGFYQPTPGKQPADDVKPGDVKVFGAPVPKLLLHHPLFEALNIGATMHRVADSYRHKEQQGNTEGAIAAALGLAEEVPFVREQTEISKLLDPNTRAAAAAKTASSIVVPAGVSQPLGWLDTSPRKPKGFWENFGMAVPGMRSTVPNRKR